MKPSDVEIVKISEAAPWMVDNEYLFTGYRKNFNNLRRILKSIIIKHNELMNIWTHLIGTIIFIGIFIYLASNRSSGKFQTNSVKDHFKKMYTATGTMVGKFKQDLNPLMSNMGETLSIINIANINDYLQNSKSRFVLLKEKYKQNYFDFKGKLEEKEIAFIHSAGKHLDNCLTTLDDLNHQIQRKYSKMISNNSETDEETLEDLSEDNSGLLEDTINGMLAAFEKLIPKETSINKLFQEFETYLEIYPFFIFLASAIFCLLSSTIYHWFHSISKTICKFLHRVDMAGISIINFGSAFTVFFYYFYCMPYFQVIYSVISFILCFGVFIISIGNTIHKPEYFTWKSYMFGALGLYNIIPLGHLLILTFMSNDSNDYMPFNSAFLWFFIEAALYLVGLAIYTLRFPEKYYPNTFDIWFNSHTIWHIFVFLAALSHLNCVIIIYRTRLQCPCLT